VGTKLWGLPVGNFPRSTHWRRPLYSFPSTVPDLLCRGWSSPSQILIFSEANLLGRRFANGAIKLTALVFPFPSPPTPRLHSPGGAANGDSPLETHWRRPHPPNAPEIRFALVSKGREGQAIAQPLTTSTASGRSPCQIGSRVTIS
jgi:hypothetical protein